MRRAQPHTFWSYLLLLAFAAFSIAGWVRLGSSIVQWNWLEQAGLTPGPLYLALTGGLWGAAGAVCVAWLLWRLRGWRVVVLAAALVLCVSYWIDRLLVAEAQGNLSNTVFVLVVTAAGLGFTALLLRSTVHRNQGK